MTKKLKFGVIGVGVPEAEPHWKAPQHYHVPSIAWARYFPQIYKNPNTELIAICDIVPERMEKVKKVYPVKETYTDYREMIEKSDIDIVVITTPHKFHYQMALDAIKAGKHLIIEKPIAISSREAKEIVEESRKKNVKIMPVPWVYDEALFKIHEMISKGYLGKVGLLSGRLGHMGPRHATWFWKKGFGSGVTFDLGIYITTILTGIAGPAKRVLGLMSTTLPKRVVEDKEVDVEVEDNAIILLDFNDGVLGKISVNYITQALTGPLIEVYGSQGLAQIDESGRLRFLTSDLDVKGMLISQSPMFIMSRFPNEPIVDLFVKFIMDDVDLSSYNDHQVHVIEILEKALISSKDGKAENLTTTFNHSELIDQYPLFLDILK